jgi:2-hydroxy-3-oxopropionate reductase
MTEQHTTLGFIGIGRMGAPMAQRLLDAGYGLTIYDTNTAAVETLVAKGARRAESPKAVGDAAEIVLLSLPMPDIMTAVALGADGVVNGAKVRTVVDLSTSRRRAALTLADGLKARDIAAIDCPVSGGVAGATKGTLALMASGDPAHFKTLEPVLAHLGKVFYVGEAAGMGQTMKVINNLISVTALSITAEAMAVGTKAGLDADAMIEVINAGSGRSNASADKIPKYVLTGSFDFGFALGLSAKDVRLCLEESEAMGIHMRVGDAARQLLNAAHKAYGDQADLTELARFVEEDAGVKIRSKAAAS